MWMRVSAGAIAGAAAGLILSTVASPLMGGWGIGSAATIFQAFVFVAGSFALLGASAGAAVAYFLRGPRVD